MSYLFVVGAHRSGTSMTCQVLDTLGVSFGTDLAKGNRDNREGYYENRKMRRLIKSWLRRLDCDPMGQWPMPERGWVPETAEVEQFRREVRRALGPADAHKDPKSLAIWQLFQLAFPDARWLVVHRDTWAIARSCMHTAFMVRHNSMLAWERWAREMRVRLQDVVCATDAVEVWPDPHRPESFRPLERLGLTFDAAKVANVLRPELWTAPRCPSVSA